jgi:hypothetical protein
VQTGEAHWLAMVSGIDFTTIPSILIARPGILIRKEVLNKGSPFRLRKVEKQRERFDSSHRKLSPSEGKSDIL